MEILDNPVPQLIHKFKAKIHRPDMHFGDTVRWSEFKSAGVKLLKAFDTISPKCAEIAGNYCNEMANGRVFNLSAAINDGCLEASRLQGGWVRVI
jgi:hypothetical protein